MSWNGKYSAHGRPPPNEMRPGLERYLAAPLSEELPRDLDSALRRSGVSQYMFMCQRQRMIYESSPWLACHVPKINQYGSCN